MKNSSDTIGNRTRDLPTCSTVPQPTTLPRAPIKLPGTCKFCNLGISCLNVEVSRSLSLSLSHTHTHTHTQVHMPSRTSLNEEPACCKAHYLHNTQQTSMPSVGFEPVIPATKWLQIYILDCMATEISCVIQAGCIYYHIYCALIRV